MEQQHEDQQGMTATIAPAASRWRRRLIDVAGKLVIDVISA